MARRALGLIRVSKEREGLVSPDIQRTAITDHCKAKGYTVGGWLEGIDQSGSQRASAWWPTLEKAIGQVEAGDYDTLVVWKFSRTARNRLKWATAVDRVEAAGGTIESATEQFDTTTSSGRFARGMLAELNAFEAERIGEVWRDVHADRLRRGLTHNGRARFGYTYTDGLHQPHPDTGPLLAHLYRRFTAGESVYRLTRYLNDRGVTTTTGGMWTDRSLNRVLDSGFGAGLVYLEHRPPAGQRRQRDPEWVNGSHAPVISAEEWADYLAAKKSRARVAPRSQRSPYLLSGLVRCAHCQGSMTAGTFGTGHAPMYRCETTRATGGHGCKGGGYVPAAAVHEAVHTWLLSLVDDLEAAGQEAATNITAAADSTAIDAERLAREVTRLEGALVRLKQQHAEDEDDDVVTFRAARDDYVRRIATAREEHELAVLRGRRLGLVPADVVRPLLAGWTTIGTAGKRAVLRDVVARVMVEKKQRGTAPGVEVVPVWSPSA